MRYFFEYIKRNRHVLEYLAVCAVLYSVLNLVQLGEKRDTLYGLILFVTIGFVFAVSGLYRYQKKKKKLEYCLKDPECWRMLKIEPEYALENIYLQCVENMQKEKELLTSEQDRRYTEMLEYYTLWVHQIKTPIAGMRLIFQGMEKKTEEVIELEQELFSVEQYVEMVLSYLRIGSTSNDFVFSKVSLDSVVKKTVRKYARSFIRSQITLQMDVPAREILTDEKWLAFVIGQLISNALKYTREGSVSIFMKSNDKTECEAYKTLIIKDTGIGIAPEDLPRIFENGFTGYNGRSDKKSTGIGLYLCKKIMDKLGHGLSISSELGKGTTVLLQLNRATLHME